MGAAAPAANAAAWAKCFASAAAKEDTPELKAGSTLGEKKINLTVLSLGWNFAAFLCWNQVKRVQTGSQ